MIQSVKARSKPMSWPAFSDSIHLCLIISSRSAWNSRYKDDFLTKSFPFDVSDVFNINTCQLFYSARAGEIISAAGGMQPKLYVLQAQGFSAIRANHALVPGRVPNHLHVRLLNRLQRQNPFLHIPGDLAAEMAARRSQSHSDVGLPALHGDAVNQAQVNNIEGNLRVVALAQFIPHQFFHCAPTVSARLPAIVLLGHKWVHNLLLSYLIPGLCARFPPASQMAGPERFAGPPPPPAGPRLPLPESSGRSESPPETESFSVPPRPGPRRSQKFRCGRRLGR